MQFTDEQNIAIDAIVDWYGDPDRMEIYVAGYAGVGKTTCVKEAISRIKSIYGIQHVLTGAYTGKAAHVLKKKGNEGAQTIHSMIYKCVPKRDEEGNETDEFEFVRNAQIMADLVVLDEISMVSSDIVEDFRTFKIKTIVLGDPGQLPPINGEGAFTSRDPDIFLKQIHRQAEDSPILELATMARNGIALPIGYNKGDVRVLRLTKETAEHIYNPDTQVICGLNRVRWGITQDMRKKLGFTEPFPVASERIICCKNDKNFGLFNGGMGHIKSISPHSDGAYKIAANIEGVNYKKMIVDGHLFRQHFTADTMKASWKKKLKEFDWSYVITCHKAQGSGFPDVTVIDDSDSFREHKWRWLYTAATRAETGLTILVR